MGPQSHAGRLQRRLGVGGRGRPRGRRAGLGRRRLDPHPRRLLRALRPQDPARPDLARAQGRGLHGLAVFGPIVRRVADAALFIDATSDGEPLAPAVSRPPGRLRIAFSTKLPPPILGGPDAEQRGALDTAVEILRGLGHEVFEQDPDYGAGGPAFTARYFRGIHDEGRAMAHPERLSRRTKGFMRLGAAIAPPVLDRARRDGEDAARRFGRLFEQADVLLTPMFTRRPLPIGTYEGRGALWSFNGYSRWVPYNAAFNHSGQPAAAIPVGFTPDGFPLSVQLVGRPDDEATLLSLSAQMESERPWAERVPDVAK